MLMNPILLKPTSDMGSQVIVKRRGAGQHARPRNTTAYKTELIPPYHGGLSTPWTSEYDIIVLEGAGSPAEINLQAGRHRQHGDGQSWPTRRCCWSGDIDRGGVFASLYGTVKLLDEDEQALIKGLVINKFRGDVEILRAGTCTCWRS